MTKHINKTATFITGALLVFALVLTMAFAIAPNAPAASADSYEFNLTDGTSFSQGNVSVEGQGGDSDGIYLNEFGDCLDISVSGNLAIDSIIATIGYYSDYANSVRGTHGDAPVVSGNGQNGSTYVTINNVNSNTLRLSTAGDPVQINHIVVTTTNGAPLTLNINGGNFNGSDSQVYALGKVNTLPTNVTKNGYVFKGWYDNAGLTGNPVTTIPANATGAKEYWAKWNPTITYNLFGGTINEDYQTEYVEGVGVTLPTNVTKEGCTFEGWYGNANFAGDPVTAIGTDATGGKRFWAKWSCSVTLHTNGATIGSGNVTQYIVSKGATLPTDLTNGELVFVGWYDNDEFNGNPVTTIGTQEAGAKEFWAKWVNHLHNYSAEWSHDDDKHWHACTATIGDCDAPVIDLAEHSFAESMDTVSYYRCVCGFEDADRKEVFYNTAGTFEIDTNTRQWSYTKQNVTIQVQDLGDSDGSYVSDSKSMTVTVKGNVVIKKITVTVGYVYYGGGDTLASAGSKSGNTFSGINAKTVRVYSNGRMLLKHFSVETMAVNGITYELNGGKINEKIDVDYFDYYFDNQGRTLPTNVTRDTYIFQGWYDNANLEGDPITAIPTDVTGNKTVWAKWKPTIIYNTNGGEIQDAEYATEFTPGVGATLPTTVTKDGYSFGGWWNNATFEGDPVTETGTEVTETQTYWARWYTVGYYVIGSMTDWKVQEDKLLAINTAVTETDEYYIDLWLSAGDNLKVIYGTVVYGDTGRTDIWYPDGMDNNYVIPQDGLYRVFFRPGGDGGVGWHYNVIFAKRLFAQIGDVRYHSLAEAYEAVQAGGTIKLLDDVDLTSAAQLVVTKDIKIDLDGYILTLTGSDPYKVVATDGAVITLDDTNATIGGVKGICATDAASGSYIVLGNCRLTLDAVLVRSSVVINHKREGYVVRSINEAPDADGFVTIVRPGTDQEIAADVDEWIGFVGEVQATIASKTLINTARSEYEALTEEQKALVSNLATLEADESAYIALVVETIEALPEVGVLVYGDKAAVENARTLYDALRDEEKDAFDAEALATLQAAEADMEELKTAKAAEDAIDALPAPGDLTFAGCDDLVRARIRYDKLTDYQRSKISDDRHIELTAKLEALELEATYCHAAEVVNVQIDALPLPQEIMPWNQSRIEVARAAYDALTDEEKAKVQPATVAKLEAAEDAVAAVVVDLVFATDVEDLINAIGKVEFSVESQGRIEAARDAYNALNAKQNRFVDNYATLTAAETKYLQLKADHDSDETAAAIALIGAIGEVENTPECKEKIDAARDAFDALTQGQKEFVTNYVTLEAAEIAYAAFTPVEYVAKIDEAQYTTFLAACEAAKTGDTVTLMADIDLSGEDAAYITLRRDITIDLNGHVLDLTAPALRYILWASDGAFITIDNTVPARGGVKGIIGADYRSGACIFLHSCRLTLSVEEVGRYGAFLSLDQDCVIKDINEGDPSVIGYSAIVYPIGDADYAAAVDDLINAIGLVEYTDESQALILSARDAFEALTEDQKALVTRLMTLEEAEGDYAALAAAEIEALIADEITVVEKANIEEARAIYDGLNAQQQAYIGAAFAKLHSAETTLATIIAGYIADQEDCKHGLVQISSVTGATTYSHDGTMRWYDYRDDEVLDGALGTRIHFPSNSGHNIAPGNVTVVMTAYLYEAREIEIWWKFEKSWCAQTDLTITSNTGSTTSRTIRLTQAYDGWNVERISCPAGVSTFTFACSSKYPNTQVGTAGVDFYVVPQSYSMFGDGIICAQCGAVCKHESIGLEYDAETGEYYYVCNETYGCRHPVDLSAIPADQESSFTSARAAYDALTAEQKAKVIPSELLILEQHEAFKSVIENEQAAIQSTNAVDNVIGLIKLLPESAQVTVDDKTALETARTAYNALTEEQKALIEQMLLDKLTASEGKYAELKAEDDPQKADAVTALITALPAENDIVFENRSLIEQARLAYEMLTADQKALVTSDTRNLLGAAETRAARESWEDFFPENGTYILVPVTADTKVMSSNIKIAAYNEATINDNLTNNRNGKWKIERQGDSASYALYNIYDATYNNANRLLDAAAWDSSLSDGTTMSLVSVSSGKSEYNTNVFRFSKRKGVDMEADEYYIRAVSTNYNKYNFVVTLRSGDGYNIGTYGAKNDYQVWKLIRVNGDEEFAQVVIDLIDPLPTYADTTLDDEEAIVAVRTAYNALTAYQQNLVSNRSVLFNAEQKIVDIKAANAVDAKIDLIGEVADTAESKTKIDTARSNYNALTDNQKLLVTRLDTLVAAETTCAGYVTTVITALPACADIVTGDATAIAAARTKYDALTEEEKSHVPQTAMDKLTACESTLSIISLPEIGVADVSIVTAEKLTLANTAAVQAARTEYDALTDEAKALVGDIVDTLVAAETEIANLQAAKAVNDAIVALPAIADLTAENKTAVAEVVTAYTALSAYQKGKVPAASVDKLFAEETSTIILALPAYDDMTLDHTDAVANADSYYDNLSTDQQALVLASVKTTLDVAKKKIADMTAAKAVSDEIGAIGEVEYTAQGKEKIDNARANYNGLTADQKAFLTNDEQNLFDYHYSDLQAKEAEYAAHADEAINNMISMDVDEITAGDKDDILAAWDTYDELIDEEKQLLPKDTVDKLHAAVATVEIIEITEADDIDENISDQDADAIKHAKESYDNLTPDQKDLLDEDVVNKVFASATTLEIVELPEVDEIAASDKDDILAAKEAYDNLTPEQKDLIPDDVRDKVFAAVPAVAIVELPVGEDIDAGDADAIAAAREAYDDLTEEQQALIPQATKDTLIAAEAILEIVELPVGEAIDADDADAIAAAREAYDDLTPEQKAKVPQSTKDTLIAAEAVLDIVELPVGEDISADDEDAIAAARTAFDNLTPAQQAKVPQSTKDTLIAAEAVLDIVELPAADEIEADHEDAIVAARTAFDNLTPAQQAKVPQSTVDTLVAAETTLDIVKLPEVENVGLGNKAAIAAVQEAFDGLSDDQKDKVSQDAKDKLFAATTTVAILEIPVAENIDENITDQNANAIKAAKESYDNLTDEQKDLLTDEVKNKVLTSATTLAVVELPATDEIDAGDADAIRAAKEAYDNLTSEQKDLIPDDVRDRVFAADTTIAVIEISAPGAIDEDIEADDADDIKAAKEAYDNLTPEQKALLPDEIVNKVLASSAALDIVELPDADDIDADDADAIAAARLAFNSLGDDQKGLIPQATKDTLIAAETTLTIVNLPEVEDVDLDDKAAIAAAKAAYEGLSNDQKAKVSSDGVDKLYAADTTVAVLGIDAAEDLHEDISDDKANAIKGAKAAYDALTEQQKDLLDQDVVDKVLASSAALAVIELRDTDAIDAGDANDVRAAKEAYDHLSEEQQALIPQEIKDELFAADTTIAVIEISAPGAIDEDIAEQNANAIKAAKASYDNLTPEQKALLPDEIVNKVLASATALGIVELNDGEDITIDDAQAIAAARLAYNQLSEEQQALIPQATKDTLISAEAVLEIVELPVGEDIAADDADAIAAAREAYNDLTPEQKAKVPATTVDTLVAAEAVLDIVELPVGTDIEADDADAIAAARTAYNGLSDEQKAKVPAATVDTLIAAEAVLEIVELPVAANIVADDADAIAAARTAYGKLTDEQKAKVPAATVNTLIAAETTLTIVELPNAEDVTEGDADDVLAAKEAYDNLTPEQKALLPDATVDKLMANVMTVAIIKLSELEDIDEDIDAEDAQAILTAKQAYEALSDEQKALIAPEVVNKVYAAASALAIAELPEAEAIDNDDAVAIAAAKAAYDNLTADQKALLPQETKDKLFVADTTIAVLEIAEAGAIDEDIEADDANAIKAAKEAYDNLTPEQKALLPDEIVDKVLASSAALDIIELPEAEAIDNDDAVAIAAAKAAYDNLTADQKAMLPQETVDKLFASTTTIAVIEISAPGAIDEDIEADDADDIKAAKEAYDDLTPEQKYLLPDEIVNKVLASSAALDIIELPEAMDIVAGDKDAIEAARLAFNSLSDEQQALIPQATVDTLVAAETTLEIVELPAIADIEADDKAEILAAKQAYEALSDKQKELLPAATVDKLFAADTTIAVLEIAVAEDIDEDIAEQNANAIKTAKASYDNLTDKQKPLLPEAIVNKVLASSAALTIVELNDGEDISADDAQAIAAARLAYNQLSEEQQALIPQTTKDTLIAAEAVLNIVELPVGTNIKATDEAAIAAAREAYTKLSDDQKAKVPAATVDTLVAAETVLEIVELPIPVNIVADDADDIAAARLAYNQLSAEQKAKVPVATVNTLVAAETTLTIVKLPDASEVAFGDKDAIVAAKAAYNTLTKEQQALLPAATVDKLFAADTAVDIVRLPDETLIAESDAQAIAAARASYNELTEKQKGLVPQTTLDKLVASETTLTIVELSAEEDITVDDAQAIAAAREAYDKLSEKQLERVPAAIKDKLVSSEVILEIVELPVGTDIEADDATAIAAARTAYNTLSPDQKAKVPAATVDTLVAAEAVLDIVELPVGTNIKADDAEAIAAARTAYNTLSPDQKAKVPAATVDTLVAAEAVLDIVELPVGTAIESDDAEAIAAAREAYDKLSAEQKAKVPAATVDTLVAAETVLEIVELPAALEIQADDRVDIEAARASYKALSDDQKAKVPTATVDTLVAAETTLTIVELPVGEYIDKGDAQAIAAARTAYNGLSAEQKAKVPAATVDTLVAAETVLTIVKLPEAIAIEPGDRTAIEAAREAYQTISDKQKGRVPQATVDTLVAAETTLTIVELPVGEDIDKGDAEAIAAAREAYTKLSDDQKAKVPAATVDTLVAAETVLEIVELPVGTAIETDDAETIAAAREAYDKLTAEQKAKVPAATVDTLVAAETTLTIVELPVGTAIEADDAEAIAAAREAYDELTAEQKAKVAAATVDTLVAAETTLTIVELPEASVIEADDEESIQAAREAYDALSDEQKAKVPQSTVDTLVVAETTLTIVELPETSAIVADDRETIEAARAAYEALSQKQQGRMPKDAMDTLSACETTLSIVEIPAVGVLTLDEKDDVVAARAAYTALTAEGKAKVPAETLAKLVAAETEIADIEAALNVEQTIGALPATSALTREDQEAVIAAREAYDALSEYQQSKVPAETLASLVAAEDVYVAMDKIDAIGVVAYTPESKALIDDAKEWYDALSDEQKAAIDNADDLQQANTDYNAVDEVFNKIETIDNIRYDDRSGNAIEGARTAYASLTVEQKALLSSGSYQKLVDAEMVYETLGKIDAIGKVEYSDESKVLIDEARLYYESLSDEQKALINVNDYETLTVSEDNYSAKDNSAKATYTSLLVIVSILLAAGLVVLGAMAYLLMKGKKKGPKTLSVALLPILLGASHYIDSPFVALYVLIGLLLIVVAVIVTLVLQHPELIKQLIKLIKREEIEEEAAPVAEEEKKANVCFYRITKDSEGQCTFALLYEEGDCLSREMGPFKTEKIAYRTIKTLRDKAQNAGAENRVRDPQSSVAAPKFVLDVDKKGVYRYRFVDEDGNVLLESVQYLNEKRCVQDLNKVLACILTEEVVCNGEDLIEEGEPVQEEVAAAVVEEPIQEPVKEEPAEEPQEEQLSLKESLAKAKVTETHNARTKADIAKILGDQFGDEVELNTRGNETKTGLPLADTHYFVEEDGKSCFVYVYETNGTIVLLLRLEDEDADKVREQGHELQRSAFPKSKNRWYSIVLDDGYSDEDIRKLFAAAYGADLPEQPAQEESHSEPVEESQGQDETPVEEEPQEEQLSLKESLALAKETNTHNAHSKADIVKLLQDKFGDKVEINTRGNETKTGLPLADTHYALGEKGKKCFIYVYEINGTVVMLLRLDDEFVQQEREELGIQRSAFPKSKDAWFSVVVNDNYSEDDIDRILAHAFHSAE